MIMIDGAMWHSQAQGGAIEEIYFPKVPFLLEKRAVQA